jgi:predicted transcriptional regulator
MAKSKNSSPTSLETQALQFLHRHGSATVREFFQKGGLNEVSRPYTTLMSLLVEMYEKGFVTRTREGRAFRYKPTMGQAEFRKRSVQQVLEDMFGGDIEALLAVLEEVHKRVKKKK